MAFKLPLMLRIPDWIDLFPVCFDRIACEDQSDEKVEEVDDHRGDSSPNGIHERS